MRILIVRLGAMGDVIHVLPAVASLHASLPGAEIIWAVDPKWAPLLEGNKHIHSLIHFDRRDWASFPEAIRQLRSAAFDFAIDFQGLVKSALLAAVASPKEIYGFAQGQARETPATWCYSNRIEACAAHIVDRNLELAANVGAHTMIREFLIPTGTPEGELPDSPFVLANPLAGWKSKQWPLEYFNELAARLDVPLVLNGAPSSADELGQVRRARIHISGIPGLIDATRRAAAVVGVDSGPLHLAAALGKPGAAIFGPTDPARNGPYGGSVEVLRAQGAATTYQRGNSISESMQSIQPQQMLTLLKRILDHGPIS